MIHKLLDAFGAYCKVQAPISMAAEWPWRKARLSS